MHRWANGRNTMKHIYIINGPNLNRLGKRDPLIYGNFSYPELVETLTKDGEALGLQCRCFQSNHEGVIIDLLHEADDLNIDGIILNPGAYTHYSYAIHDAIEAIKVPVVEVHLSDLAQRKESWRHTSMIRPVVVTHFSGEQMGSYQKALVFLKGL